MPYSKERSKAARKFVREHNTAAKLKDNKATIKKRKNVMSDFIFIVSIFDLIETSDFEMLCKLLGLNIESEWLEKEYDDIMWKLYKGCVEKCLGNENFSNI